MGWHQKNFTAALDLHRHALNHSSSHLCATIKLINMKIKPERDCWNLPQLAKHWRSISSCYLRLRFRPASKPPLSIHVPPCRAGGIKSLVLGNLFEDLQDGRACTGTPGLAVGTAESV